MLLIVVGAPSRLVQLDASAMPALSWPTWLRPQHFTVLSLIKPQVTRNPATILEITPLNPGTGAGVTVVTVPQSLQSCA